MFERARRRLIEARDSAYASILQPGERLIATGMVAAAFIGSDDIADLPGDESGVERIVARLAFADGSRITVTAGMFLPARANRLVAALTTSPSRA